MRECTTCVLINLIYIALLPPFNVFRHYDNVLHISVVMKTEMKITKKLRTCGPRNHPANQPFKDISWPYNPMNCICCIALSLYPCASSFSNILILKIKLMYFHWFWNICLVIGTDNYCVKALVQTKPLCWNAIVIINAFSRYVWFQWTWKCSVLPHKLIFHLHFICILQNATSLLFQNVNIQALIFS